MTSGIFGGRSHSWDLDRVRHLCWESVLGGWGPNWNGCSHFFCGDGGVGTFLGTRSHDDYFVLGVHPIGNFGNTFPSFFALSFGRGAPRSFCSAFRGCGSLLSVVAIISYTASSDYISARTGHFCASSLFAFFFETGVGVVMQVPRGFLGSARRGFLGGSGAVCIPPLSACGGVARMAVVVAGEATLNNYPPFKIFYKASVKVNGIRRPSGFSPGLW